MEYTAPRTFSDRRTTAYQHSSRAVRLSVLYSVIAPDVGSAPGSWRLRELISTVDGIPVTLGDVDMLSVLHEEDVRSPVLTPRNPGVAGQCSTFGSSDR